MDFHLLENFKTILLADIGENDTTTTMMNIKLSKDILSIVQQIRHGVEVKLVIVSQLICLIQLIQCAIYTNVNDTLLETNQCLQQPSYPLCGIDFWSHTRYWRSRTISRPWWCLSSVPPLRTNQNIADALEMLRSWLQTLEASKENSDDVISGHSFLFLYYGFRQRRIPALDF